MEQTGQKRALRETELHPLRDGVAQDRRGQFVGIEALQGPFVVEFHASPHIRHGKRQHQVAEFVDAQQRDGLRDGQHFRAPPIGRGIDEA